MSETLHTYDQGSGPPVLFVHGFPLNHQMWRCQLDALASDYRVIAPDLRGFGKSDIASISSKTGVEMSEFADDLALLLDRLEVAEPVTLVGFSMGGYIGWQFFKQYRQRLAAMVLCDTKAAADTPQAREIRYRMAEGVEGWGSSHVAMLMTSKLFGPQTLASNQPLVDEVTEMISSTNPVTIAAAQRGMAHRDDSTDLLPTLDLPTLYLCGRDDQISPPDEMQAMADATPGATYVEIPSAGHMSPMENPTAVNEALRSFLAR
ncbi:alpha/beta fold hydrolase [Aeoliella mucimassa]|uniref:AB hydrolase superfamily protein YdjP n=1 Tax=Aeoliella mucimassa TaxID=2527972 RepID=A0A518AJK7_9BACT|nr:alpha/beta hydrolase [Aeoliella mucimassa]QDU54866.1 AB hydrolase superfamily protein YdjP [Aeoliella mucimassa]